MCPSVCLSATVYAALRVASHLDYRLVSFHDFSNQFISVALKRTYPSCDIQVKFDPAYEFLNDFDRRPELRSHFTATAVRVVLVRPACTEPLLSYYAIAHFSIKGQCQCYGHASSCSGQVISAQATVLRSVVDLLDASASTPPSTHYASPAPMSSTLEPTRTRPTSNLVKCCTPPPE